MVIEDFSTKLRKINMGNGKCKGKGKGTGKPVLKGESFEAAGLPWHLNVYPRGNKSLVSAVAVMCSGRISTR